MGWVDAWVGLMISGWMISSVVKLGSVNIHPHLGPVKKLDILLLVFITPANMTSNKPELLLFDIWYYFYFSGYVEEKTLYPLLFIGDIFFAELARSRGFYFSHWDGFPRSNLCIFCDYFFICLFCYFHSFDCFMFFVWASTRFLLSTQQAHEKNDLASDINIYMSLKIPKTIHFYGECIKQDYPRWTNSRRDVGMATISKCHAIITI